MTDLSNCFPHGLADPHHLQVFVAHNSTQDVYVSQLVVVMQYPMCLELVSEAKIDVAAMISHRFGFSAAEITAGFKCAADASDTKAVKVMFHLPDPSAEGFV